LTASKLPLRLAGVGIAVGFAFMAMNWYDLRYNPFHMPTSDQLWQVHYTVPPLYWFLKELAYVLCPALFPGAFFAMDLGERVGWIVWVVVALLNGPIYYCAGLGIAALMRYVRQRAPQNRQREREV
jgi:hypothetical protein